MMDEGFPLVQLELAGYDRPYERHGNKYVVTSPGCYLKYENMQDTKNESGRMLQIRQKDPLTGVCVQTDIQFYDGVPVARFVNHVTNEGEEEQVLTYLPPLPALELREMETFCIFRIMGGRKS